MEAVTMLAKASNNNLGSIITTLKLATCGLDR